LKSRRVKGGTVSSSETNTPMLGFLWSRGMNKLSGTQKALALGGYAVGINATAVGLFYYDKQQALQKEWRVRY